MKSLIRYLFITILIALVFIAPLFSQIRSDRRTSNNTAIDYSNPKEYEIAGISVEGSDYLDKNALISLSGLKVGDKVTIPGDDVTNVIKKLWRHGIIGDVTIYLSKLEGTNIDLIIELAERPRLSRFTFEGVNKTQEGDLSDNIKLIKGKILTDADVKKIELTTKKHFIDKGFLNTEVKIIQQKDTLVSNGIKMTIIVDKKQKVKIEQIEFLGNENISDNKLKRKFKNTNEKARFRLFSQAMNQIFNLKLSSVKEFVDSTQDVSSSDLMEFINDNIKLNFFKSAKYQKDDYEEDKKSLISFYNSKGYRDATIISDTIYRSGENDINIDLTVDEGRKYFFRNITWTGNYVHGDEVLSKILSVSKGDVYDMETLNKNLTFNPTGPDISGLYMDDGYLFFNIQPVEVRVQDDSIDIEMRVFEGSQATINRIIISGNDRTNDHVILRELKTYPGQKFSRSDLIRTQQRLATLGYFDPEQIDIKPIPNPLDGTVDIVYNLVEKPSDQIQLSGGWGGSFGFIGTLGLSFNNFSLKNIPHVRKWRPLPVGDGQKLTIRAQANGRQFQSYTFGFSDPWLGGKKPNSFSISYNQSIQRAFNSSDPSASPFIFNNDFNAKLILRSVSLGLGRQLEWPDNYFVLSNSITYTNYRLDNWFAGSLGFSDGNSNNITFNTTIARSNVDQPMYPRSGSSISLSINLTPPYSLWRDLGPNAPNEEKFKWVEFHKWMFDAKYYVKIAGDLVLETKAHIGLIGSYGSEIGPFERFRLGGDGLAGQNFILGTDVIGMRGYENNALTPPNYGSRPTASTAAQLDGGIVYNKYSMELRYPVTTGQAATIYLFGFGEAGNNWNNYEEFNPFNLFRSAGLGARIFMPAFGLIGINWGYGFDKVPGQLDVSGPQFQFTIGQQLR